MKKCLNYDLDSLTCENMRGRLNNGKRAPCYKISKKQIREQKKGILEKFFNELEELFGDINDYFFLTFFKNLL